MLLLLAATSARRLLQRCVFARSKQQQHATRSVRRPGYGLVGADLQVGLLEGAAHRAHRVRVQRLAVGRDRRLVALELYACRHEPRLGPNHRLRLLDGNVATSGLAVLGLHLGVHGLRELTQIFVGKDATERDLKSAHRYSMGRGPLPLFAVAPEG